MLVYSVVKIYITGKGGEGRGREGKGGEGREILLFSSVFIF